MKHLIATVPVLRGNTQYEIGAELPAYYADELIEAGSAVWKDDEEPKKKAPKAKPAAAQAGRTGDAQPATSAEPDLVGKVPSPKARGVVKQPKKRAPKSKA